MEEGKPLLEESDSTFFSVSEENDFNRIGASSPTRSVLVIKIFIKTLVLGDIFVCTLEYPL